jgi:hypothetical protein
MHLNPAVALKALTRIKFRNAADKQKGSVTNTFG